MLAASCGGPTPARPPARSGPSAPAATAAPLAAWQRLGATEVPPESALQVSPGGAQVLNQTQGAVPDSSARAWVEAFLREFAYLRWAVSRGQDQFLLRSGLSSVPFVAFQPNLNDIYTARAAGDRVEYTLQTFRRFVVRPVPQGMRASIERARYAWKPYAIYVDAIGPVETDWIDARGNRTARSRAPAGAPLYELVGGELGHDPTLGDVWVVSSDFDCTAPSSRQTLAPLCNP